MRHARDGWLGPDGTWHAGDPPRGWRVSRDGRWRPTLAAQMRAPRYVPPPPAQPSPHTVVETGPDAALMRRHNPHRQDPTQTGPSAGAPTRPGDTVGGHAGQHAARGGTSFWADEADGPGDATAEGGDVPRHLGNTGVREWALVPGLRAIAQRAIVGLRSTTVRTRIGAGVAAVVLLVGLIAATITVFGSSGGDGTELASSPSGSSSESATDPPANPDGGTSLEDLLTTDSSPRSTTTAATESTEPTTTTEPSTSTTGPTTETSSAAPPPSSSRSPSTDRRPDTTEPPASTEQDVYYRNCGEVRRRGIGGLRPGDPGYRPGLDHNGSGVACAPE